MHRARMLVALVVALACLLGTRASAEALPDGDYAPDVFRFSGGTGRVTITCPQVRVRGGEAEADIVFSSPHYTTVTLDGAVYEGAVEGDATVFHLPVPLNRTFDIAAVTTAMSRPHEIVYTLYIQLGGAGELPGLTWEGSMALDYAEGFTVDYYAGGYALIDVKDGARCLAVPKGQPVPEGLDPGILVLQKPIDSVYLAATSAMALFDRLDALDSVRFSSLRAEDWHVENAAAAMRDGRIAFAGKYSEPDYELLVKEGCALAIESTMIAHAPKTQELLELLGIPVFVDRSSYEAHPLGRVEWIKLYGVLLDKEEQAQAFFDGQKEVVEVLSDFPPSGKTVAFFYLGADGAPVVRGADDYVARMIALGGGTYAFAGMRGAQRGHASVAISMEDFYAGAADADYLIYSAAIDDSVDSLEKLCARSALLSDFRAVREGHVFLAGGDLYQATDTAALLIGDIHDMLSGREDGMTFLTKMN